MDKPKASFLELAEFLHYIGLQDLQSGLKELGFSQKDEGDRTIICGEIRLKGYPPNRWYNAKEVVGIMKKQLQSKCDWNQLIESLAKEQKDD